MTPESETTIRAQSNPERRTRSRSLLRRFLGARSERGAEMIEFALILPAFVVLVYGSISGATVYSHKQDVINAVRDGSRYGATVPQAQCTPISNCNNQDWAQMVQALVV